MSKAEKQLQAMAEYYDSEDFRGYYIFCLLEDLQYNGVEAIKQNAELWDKIPSSEQIEKVIEYIGDNLEDYIQEFSHYYVGYDCIASVSFGEQEVEIPEGFNPEEDDDCGFYIADNGCAYYDLSAKGIYIKCDEEKFYDILNQLESEGE